MIRITNARRALSGRCRVAVVVFGLALALGSAAGQEALAGSPTCNAGGNAEPFVLTARALATSAQTDVYTTVSSTVAGSPVPHVLKKVQIKALAADGSTAGVSNYFDVPSAGGVGTVAPPDLSRGQRLEVTALVQTPEAVQTDVLHAEATVRLRPDLVAALSGPSRVVRKQPFAFEVRISEIARDTGASARVLLYDGTNLLAQAPVSVAAGGTTTVSFASLRISAVDTHTLVARITDASPAELDETNDSANAALAVARYDADGAVISENYEATKIGADILRAGGNAIDAAAAVQWALNVAEPENTGLGGGVNAIVHLANGEEFALDGRETTPAAVDKNFYASKSGFARNGYSAGVPGTLATIDYMLGHWGTMTLAQTLAPAIDLTQNGVVVSRQLATSINNRGAFDPDTKAIYYPGGVQKREGDTLVNPDLAKTFRLIAAQGPSVFYDGEIADAIVAAQQKSFDPGMGGVMTRNDLRAFTVEVTKPISIDYRGYKVESVGPSTGGGIVVLQMLKMVERFRLGSEPDWGFESPNVTQTMLEAMRLGFADKAMWMGDNRRGFYSDMPLAGLLSSTYLAQRSSLIDPAKRMPPNPPPGDPRGIGASSEPVAPEPEAEPGGHTSHFAIIDRWGNVVSATTTLGDGLGCTITVPGYGFVLNDASGRNLNRVPVAGRIKAGIVDPGANDAAGGKRGLGNVAPVIVLRDGEPVLATGGAGGAQIMPVVFEIVTDVLDFHKTLQQALNAPRIWGDENNVIWNPAPNMIPLTLPSKLMGVQPWSEIPPWFEGAPAFPDTTLQALRALGDPLTGSLEYPQVGGTQSIAVDPDTYALSAAADPRGLWAVGGPIILKP